MADPVQDAQSRIPAVFAEAPARGVTGLWLAPTPAQLVCPVTGQPVASEASYPERYGARSVIYKTSAVACARRVGASRPLDALTPEDDRRFIEGTGERMLARLGAARPTPRRA
jgi:hypothetical protein